MQKWNQITIVGMGLIGGSLGMAIKRNHLANRVVGLSRSTKTLTAAKRKRAIDDGTTNPKKAVEEADIVVIASPVDLIVPIAKLLTKSMRPGSLLTDVGSTKGEIVHSLDRMTPPHIKFVGSHPIAGSDQRGIEAAKADLFTDTACIMTPTRKTSKTALNQLKKLWRGVGQSVVTMSPLAHDRLLAGTSHLPHLVASCLAEAVSHQGLKKAPRSFLDMTRIAQSDPDLWDDIFMSNRDELLAVMARFEKTWTAFKADIEKGRRAPLRKRLQRTQESRRQLA